MSSLGSAVLFDTESEMKLLYTRVIFLQLVRGHFLSKCDGFPKCISDVASSPT